MEMEEGFLGQVHSLRMKVRGCSTLVVVTDVLGSTQFFAGCLGRVCCRCGRIHSSQPRIVGKMRESTGDRSPLNLQFFEGVTRWGMCGVVGMCILGTSPTEALSKEVGC